MTTFRASLVAAIPQLRIFARSFCRRNPEKADDLVQDTLVAALANQDKFDGSNLGGWLYTIMLNKLRSNHKKYRREVEDPDGKIAADVMVIDDPMPRMELSETIAAVNRLPDGWRDPLLMFVDGMSYPEIAAEMRINEGTIKSRISRARACLGER